MPLLEDGNVAGFVAFIDHLLQDRLGLAQQTHLLDEGLPQL